MRLLAKLTGVLALFLAGFYGRALWEGEVDRPQAMLHLFETYCLPIARGEAFAPGPELTALKGPSGVYWADPVSVVTLRKTGKQDCAVSDELQVLSPDEQDRLRPLVEAMVSEKFPELTIDPSSGLESWDEFVVWAKYPAFHRLRRGVLLHRMQESGEHAATTLKLAAKHPDDPSQAERSPAR